MEAFTSLDDLLRALAARAADPDRRTELAGRLSSLRGVLSRALGRGLRPAPMARIRAAERELDVVLPPLLVRLYTEVDDGGFGPGTGLLPLGRVIAETQGLRSGAPLPRRRRWPESLLPLVERDPGWLCVDVITGEIVEWDPEDVPEWASQERFERSFEVRWSTLEDWLAKWVRSKTAADRNKLPARERWARMEARAKTPQGQAHQARKTAALIAAMTPEERRKWGLTIPPTPSGTEVDDKS